MGVYLRAKFEVCSLILTCFRQGGNFTPPPPQNETRKSPPRLKLRRPLRDIERCSRWVGSGHP